MSSMGGEGVGEGEGCVEGVEEGLGREEALPPPPPTTAAAAEGERVEESAGEGEEEREAMETVGGAVREVAAPATPSKEGEAKGVWVCRAGVGVPAGGVRVGLERAEGEADWEAALGDGRGDGEGLGEEEVEGLAGALLVELGDPPLEEVRVGEGLGEREAGEERVREGEGVTLGVRLGEGEFLGEGEERGEAEAEEEVEGEELGDFEGLEERVGGRLVGVVLREAPPGGEWEGGALEGVDESVGF